ncbi:MAG: glycosyltransferase family 4 protein [bacterium]
MKETAFLKTIAIVSEDLSYPLDEGFKKATAAIAVALATSGVRTVLFARQSSGLMDEGARPQSGALPDIRPISLPDNKFLLGGAFARALKQVRADAILYVPEAAATPMSMIRAGLIRRQAGGPPVALLSLQERTHAPGIPRLLRGLGAAPGMVLALSERSRRAFAQAGLSVRRVPLGVDTDLFRPPAAGERDRLRQKYGLPQGPIVLHVGHVSPRRNLELLRPAARSGTTLVIVASTSTSRDPAVRRAFEGSSVVFIDTYLEHIEEIYRAADCYVFPTADPTGAIEVPLSVLEAMAANLSVVTTPFGGLPDLFAEGRGLFFASSPGEFGAKTDAALACGDVATRAMVADLTWSKAADRILEALEELARGGRRD